MRGLKSSDSADAFKVVAVIRTQLIATKAAKMTERIFWDSRVVRLISLTHFSLVLISHSMCGTEVCYSCYRSVIFYP